MRCGNNMIDYVPKFSILLLVLLQGAFIWSAPQDLPKKRFLFTEPTKAIPGPEKNYTGLRVCHQCQIMAYYHEQTIGVVELGSKRELLNCELLEVKTKLDQEATLKILKSHKIKKQGEVNFKDMLDILKHCQEVDIDPKEFKLNLPQVKQGRSVPNSISTVFQGIFPGTKWCGRGDLAATYFDLGEEKAIDKCCRSHDMCPVKVSAMRTQYNITNYSMVTRSHCSCDEVFYNCLKNIKNSLTDLIGNLYFNIGDPTCVDDKMNSNTKFLRPNMLRY